MSAPAQDDGRLREAAAVLSAVLGEAAPPEVDLFALLRKHGGDAALAADRFFAQQEQEEQRAAPEPEPPPRAPPTSAALHVRAVVNGGVRRGPSANGRAACSLTAHGAPTAESLGSQLKGTNAWPKPFGCLFVKAFSLVKQSANELVLLEGDPLELILPAPTAAKSHIKGKPHKGSIDETIRLCRQRNLSGGDGVGGSGAVLGRMPASLARCLLPLLSEAKMSVTSVQVAASLPARLKLLSEIPVRQESPPPPHPTPFSPHVTPLVSYV